MSDGDRCLSKRGQASTSSSLPYYIRLYLNTKGNLWSEKNPEGVMLMSVAENILSVDLLQEKLKEYTEYPAQMFSYGELGGELQLKKAFAKLLNATFLQKTELNHRNMIIATGASAVLESLFFSILDPGDGVMILAPFYAGYRFDISYRVQGKMVPVHLNFDQDIKKQLADAKEQSEAQGIPIRALLITNPDNPTGIVYPESLLRDAAEWCADNQLHIIANEVYANTIFYEEPVTFRSLFEVGQELGRPELKDRLHLIYALSKDFCGSGFRIGIFYSESQSICSIFEDEAFVQSFISENTKRVQTSYENLSSALTEANISFIRPQGGIFLWIDLRSSLPTPDSKGEEWLCERLAEAGLLFSPGETFYASEPGFFRICYAAVPPSAIPVAVARLRKALHQQSDKVMGQ